jgi:hypothetical protein
MTQSGQLKPPTSKPPTIGKMHQLSARFTPHQKPESPDFRHLGVWHA